MESVKPEATHTLTCRVCKSPVGVGPTNRSYQYWIARCENCGLRVEESLPPIKKKIIYLDQFVLSHILADKDPRWQQVYKRLQLLSYLHVIVCPFSEIHIAESLVAVHSRDKLKELYRELSHGVRFAFIDSIEQAQLHRTLGRFLFDQYEEEINYTEFCNKDPNRWELDLQVYADFPIKSDHVASLQARKEQLQQALDSEAESWRLDERKFKDDARREALKYVRSLMSDYHEFDAVEQQLESMLPEPLANVYRQSTRAGKFDPYRPPSTKPGAMLVHSMVCRVHRARPDELNPVSIVEDFLLSDHAINQTPFLAIMSRLWAGVAAHSRNPTGQRDPMANDKNDILSIAHFAWYCDAMVVDNYFRGLATQGNIGIEKDFRVKLFSPKTLPQFIEFLDELLHNIPQDHRLAIKKVMPHLAQSPILNTDQVTSGS